MTNYAEFLSRKSQSMVLSGFEPLWLPDVLFDFQKSITEWAIRKGRGAILAGCGLGKTLMQLVFAENICRKTEKPSLILAPLVVSMQTAAEAERFGIDCQVSRLGTIHPRITVTNYERLHYFRPDNFACVICDESSILKNFDGKMKRAVTEFMRTVPYRLLCTATPAPNDYDELGTSSEALGELGYTDMLTRFFKQETKKDYLGWGRTKYRLVGHAQEPFWRWVCSWAMACRKPSDVGGDDKQFILPKLVMEEHEVKARNKRSGFLWDMPAVTLAEQREEQRRTMTERCERVAELVSHDEPAICWCHLNPEGDLLEKLVPDSVQVSGADTEETKEQKLLAFLNGSKRVLVSKPQLTGFGLNFQHCAHQTFFPSHSWERFFQATRRSWRFGQKKPVRIDVVTTDGSARVMANFRRKHEAAEKMQEMLIAVMHRCQAVERSKYGDSTREVPPWLGTSFAAADRNDSLK